MIELLTSMQDNDWSKIYILGQIEIKKSEALKVLVYLFPSQEADGHCFQWLHQAQSLGFLK